MSVIYIGDTYEALALYAPTGEIQAYQLFGGDEPGIVAANLCQPDNPPPPATPVLVINPISVDLSGADLQVALSNTQFNLSQETIAALSSAQFVLSQSSIDSLLAGLGTTKTILSASGTVATAGNNTVIAAPGVGFQLVIFACSMQNESSTATVMLLRGGSTTFHRVLGQNQGDGELLVLPANREFKLGENVACNFNLSGSNQCNYSIYYYVDPV